ncbi:MAG: metallophosphatase domain-containing protein [Deltaproteobacteria bacterium]|nr:metallophosphatase domain-containing protein [Deltaproteobacteria bacterium]
MRIVAVADTHLFVDDIVIPDGDVFIHAGDMCRRGDLEEIEQAAAWIASLPHRHKIVIAGNHDWLFAEDPKAARAVVSQFHYLEDSEIELEGLRFYGSPWQPEFNDWAFNLPRGEPLAAVWRKIPRGIDVLITHGPPDGIGDRSGMDARAGCADLRARVAEVAPRLHLFGHIHQDGGVWTHGSTVFANVTTWECERAPTVFEIDAQSVTPIEVPFHGRRDDDF